VRREILVSLILLGACSHPPSDTSPFTGTWVMNVSGRPFLVLTLEPEADHFAGTLERPRRMTTNGRTFSKIGSEASTRPVVTSAPENGTLRFVTTATDDPNDKIELELSVSGAAEGRLRLVGAPFEPWAMFRHAGGNLPRVWTGWDENRTYALDQPFVAPNAEMAEIYTADQAARQSMTSFQAQSAQIEKDDAARRERTRALLEGGELKAAEDFRLAALVFQHGTEPRDYLFAHTLALVALAKGDPGASWIAAASMDRYLTSIGQPQVFGSQFDFDGTHRGRFDAGLVSDALRRELGVPARAEQEAQMQQLLRK
jgi:hypothetical protein